MDRRVDEAPHAMGSAQTRMPAPASLPAATPGPPPGASATVMSGFYEGLEVLIDRERIVVGRGRDADLALAEATISRAHAAIGFDAEGFYVEDLGSTNGTTVNGSRITRQRLKDDDEIQMGKLRIGVTLPV